MADIGTHVHTWRRAGYRCRQARSPRVTLPCGSARAGDDENGAGASPLAAARRPPGREVRRVEGDALAAHQRAHRTLRTLGTGRPAEQRILVGRIPNETREPDGEARRGRLAIAIELKLLRGERGTAASSIEASASVSRTWLRHCSALRCSSSFINARSGRSRCRSRCWDFERNRFAA